MIKSISVTLNECGDEALLKLIKSVGFEGLDISLNSLGKHNDFKGKIEKVKENIEKVGLLCPMVHLPYYDIFASSESFDDKKEKDIKNSFEAMSILGAKWGAYHPMSATNYDFDRKRALRDNKEKILGYLEEAAKFNVGIAVENLPIFPDCSQYKFFTYDEDDHIELVDSLNSDLVGICWDFGHANLMKYDMASVLDKVGERLKIVHVHNNTKMCDLHISPGIGTINWENTLVPLKNHGFSGTFNLELNLNLIHPVIMEDYLKMNSKMADYLISLIK